MIMSADSMHLICILIKENHSDYFRARNKLKFITGHTFVLETPVVVHKVQHFWKTYLADVISDLSAYLSISIDIFDAFATNCQLTVGNAKFSEYIIIGTCQLAIIFTYINHFEVNQFECFWNRQLTIVNWLLTYKCDIFMIKIQLPTVWTAT